MKKSVIAIAVAGVVAVAGVAYASSAKNNAVKSKIDENIASAAPFAEITYGDVSTSLMSDKITVHDLVIKPSVFSGMNMKNMAKEAPQVTIDSITVNADLDNETPTYMDISIDDMTIPPIPDRKVQRLLGAKAGDGLTMDMDMSYEFTSDSYKMTFQPDIDGIGEIESTLELSNVAEAYELAQKNTSNPMALQSDRELQAAIMKANLEEFTITLTNEGLFEAILKAQADRRKVEVSDIKAGIKKEIERGLKRAESRGFDREQVMFTQFGKFVDSPDQFTFEVEPGSKESIVDLYSEFNNSSFKKEKESGFKVTYKAH